MNHLHVLRFVNVVVCHCGIFVEDIFQKVPISKVDSSANGLAEILVRLQLGVPSFRRLFFLVFRLSIIIRDTILWGLLPVSLGLI